MQIPNFVGWKKNIYIYIYPSIPFPGVLLGGEIQTQLDPPNPRKMGQTVLCRKKKSPQTTAKGVSLVVNAIFHPQLDRWV